MDHRGDADGSLYLFRREARIAQDLFIAVDTDAATIYGRHRQTPQFEIRLVHAGLAIAPILSRAGIAL
jgi:hypothetical protein